MENDSYVPTQENYDDDGDVIKGLRSAILPSLIIWFMLICLAKPVGHFAKHTLLAMFY